MKELIAQLAQIDVPATVTQGGFGVALIWVLVTWLKKIESSLENLNHSMRTLSKAVMLDLAERAQPGSFVRTEAKRTIERMNAQEASGKPRAED